MRRWGRGEGCTVAKERERGREELVSPEYGANNRAEQRTDQRASSRDRSRERAKERELTLRRFMSCDQFIAVSALLGLGKRAIWQRESPAVEILCSPHCLGRRVPVIKAKLDYVVVVSLYNCSRRSSAHNICTSTRHAPKPTHAYTPCRAIECTDC
jgi:hypothetical protein